MHVVRACVQLTKQRSDVFGFNKSFISIVDRSLGVLRSFWLLTFLLYRRDGKSEFFLHDCIVEEKTLKQFVTCV